MILFQIQKQGATFSLLKGPTGSGKSTTVKVSAKELGIDVKEWITPANINSYTEDLDGNLIISLLMHENFIRKSRL